MENTSHLSQKITIIMSILLGGANWMIEISLDIMFTVYSIFIH